MLADGLAEDFFARAFRIGVGGVEEVDAVLERPAKERHAGVLVERPRGVHRALAVAHAAQAKPRHLESGVTEPAILHHFFSCARRASQTSRAASIAAMRGLVIL